MAGLEVEIQSREKEVVDLKQNLNSFERELEKEKAIYEENQKRGNIVQEELIHIKSKLEECDKEFKAISNEYASLKATYETLIGKKDASSSPLLKDKECLAQKIKVSEPWINACEMVFGENIRATIVDHINELKPLLSASFHGVCTELKQKPLFSDNKSRLIDFIDSDLPCHTPYLSDIFVAHDLKDGFKQLNDLQSHQSIITQDGYC